MAEGKLCRYPRLPEIKDLDKSSAPFGKLTFVMTTSEVTSGIRKSLSAEALVGEDRLSKRRPATAGANMDMAVACIVFVVKDELK